MAAVSFAPTACTHFLSRSRMTRSSVVTSARCTQPLATATRAIRPIGNSLLVGCIWPRVEGDSKDILWHPAVNGGVESREDLCFDAASAAHAVRGDPLPSRVVAVEDV